jgi:hypothetical protein
VRYQHGDNHTDGDLTRWLARQLELLIIRKARYGFSHKCEAITKQDQNANAGYQCPRYASIERDGRYLCKVHERSFHQDLTSRERLRTLGMPSRCGVNRHHGNRPVFIEERRDEVEFIEELIKGLAERDAEFMAVLRRVVNE